MKEAKVLWGKHLMTVAYLNGLFVSHVRLQAWTGSRGKTTERCDLLNVLEAGLC